MGQHYRSYWNATGLATDFPGLNGHHDVDIAIIGGGIVGMSTARALKDKGLTVAVVEARGVGRQVTGKSTAKVTSQHSLLYQTLEEKFSEHHARFYADAQESALRLISNWVERHHISCNLESKAAYTYTLDQAHVESIEKEVEITRRLGLPASLAQASDLPFDIVAAIRYENQMQFQPTSYVAGLAQTIPGDGSHVFENSKVVDWSPTRIATARGTVNARHVVMATHLPLGQVGGYYGRAFPNAEPVIAAPIDRALDGMYLNVEEPSHSIRTHQNENGQVYAVVAGSAFKPGLVDDERRRFKELESWLNQHFQTGPIEYRWVNEDYTSMDNVPFVGWSNAIGASYLVATGFAGWGISNGTAAAIMISDLVTGTENPWQDLFNARRIKPLASGTKLLKESVGVATHLVSGYLSKKPHSCDLLDRGEASIMKINGRNTAVFKDEEGVIHAVSAVCSHMGCILGWNERDRTWDCPCHGSRFELNGEVLHGPAVKPLRIERDI